ncbi:MAG: ABC transporter permease [Anaerolineales bacterium]|nr:ABC transporter permease [Anaerolineales bacterium]
MKLWHSFTKELLLASRSFYFYIEVVMAAIFLFLLLFVIPEKIEVKQDEYLYYDVPKEAFAFFEEELLSEDLDGMAETVDLDWEKETISAALYETDANKYYVIDNQEAAIQIADKKRSFAGIIHLDDTGNITYTYYLQGYETERLRNILSVFHNEQTDVLRQVFETQDVRVLHKDQVLLNDRENVLPSFLTFNGSLMGLFILAAYIFLDKKEGVIKAYAVTTSPVWHYLLSKVGVVTVTSLITSLIITIPVMGWQPNYLLMVLFLLTTGFAASAVGLLLSSFFEDIAQSFGMLIVLIVVMMLPNIAYFIPTWDPAWMPYIPTYAMLEGFKEVILPNGNSSYVLTASLVYFLAGLLLFIFANARFKKTLTI